MDEVKIYVYENILCSILKTSLEENVHRSRLDKIEVL
jgi:hypothetical protein